MKIHPTAVLLGLAGFVLAARADRPPATGAKPAWAAAEAQGKKGAQEEDFLLFGTVFTDQGFALPGAEVRVRRVGERKARWEARSDRRGEFAVHVPRGAEYEMSVSARGYQEQTRKIDAKAGNHEDLVFRMQPASGGKPK